MSSLSQGVGVGLFRDRGCAVEACNKLSGAQADGRKLELVLMNPDNHVSFSCRQVRNGSSDKACAGRICTARLIHIRCYSLDSLSCNAAACHML